MTKRYHDEAGERVSPTNGIFPVEAFYQDSEDHGKPRVVFMGDSKIKRWYEFAHNTTTSAIDKMLLLGCLFMFV